MSAQPTPQLPAQPQPGSSNSCLKAVILIFLVFFVITVAVGVGGWFYFDQETNYSPSFEVGEDRLWEVTRVDEEPFTVASVNNAKTRILRVFPFHDVVWFSAEADGAPQTRILFDVATQKSLGESSRISTEMSPHPMRFASGDALDLSTGKTSPAAGSFYQVPDGVWVFDRESQETTYQFFAEMPDVSTKRELEKKLPFLMSRDTDDYQWDRDDKALYYHSRIYSPCPLVRFQDGEGTCLVPEEGRHILRHPTGAVIETSTEETVWYDFKTKERRVIDVEGCEIDRLKPIPRADGGVALVVVCETGEAYNSVASFIWSPEGITEIERELNEELGFFDPLMTSTPTVFIEPGRQPVGLPKGALRITPEFYFWGGGIYRLDLKTETLHRIAKWDCPNSTRYARAGAGTDASKILVACQVWKLDEAGTSQSQFITSSAVIEPELQRVTFVPFLVWEVSKNYYVGHPPGFVEGFSSIVAAPRKSP